MKKILSAIIAVTMMATAFAGCSEKSSEDNSLKEVKDAGKLVLGLDDSFPPMGFRNEDNEIVGFDIDIANEVAQRMGVELVLQPIEWDSNVMELNSGSIDCIWNGMSINESRKEKMNLSDPYMKNRMVLVVLGDSGITSQADLAGKSIGVQSGSTAEGILDASDVAKTAKSIVGFKDNLMGFMDLETKGISALFIDEVFADYYIASNKKNYVVLEDGALADEEYAIGFRKNDQSLRDEVQRILSGMKADGKIAEISTKWFGSDITVVK